MPDVEKLFVQQQRAQDQLGSSTEAIFYATVSSDMSSALSRSAPASPVPSRHCSVSSMSFFEEDSAAIRHDVGDNQIFLSRPRNSGFVEIDSAPLNCHGKIGEQASLVMEKASRRDEVDVDFGIDAAGSFVRLNEEDTQNGSPFVAPEENIDQEDAAEALPPARTGSNGSGKLSYQPNNITNGAQLATVLENLPLPLQSSRRPKKTVMQPSTEASCAVDGQANAIGHSRSTQSFDPTDSSTVTNVTQQQQQNPEIRRTHARHSSYEVPASAQHRPNCSTCFNGILAPPVNNGSSGSCFAPFGRTNSLSCNGTDASSFSSSFSISSLSYSDYSASLASINDGSGCDSQHFFHKQQQDENSSKRSSLDRRSLTSFCSSSSNDDGANAGLGFAQRLNEASSGANAGNGDSTGNSGNHNKRLLPLTNILPRGLFSRKTLSITSNGNPRDDVHAAGTNDRTALARNGGGTGWKLPFRPPTALASTFGSALSLSLSSSSSLSSGHFSGKNQAHNTSKVFASDVPSTTALILQDRPATLPPKSADEEQKHRQLYEQMIEAARKKEQREAKQRKKQQRLQLKQEEMLAAAVKEWTTEILPKWEEVKNTKRVRELWGHGLPPCVRGRVWKLAIGNELSITEELFEICVNRAKERLRQFEAASSCHAPIADSTGALVSPGQSIASPASLASSTATVVGALAESPVDREGTVELIHLDVARTFPVLGIFQKGGPYYDLLLNVLGAYVCYRPDVGYVQGMSFLAAVLLLNMDASDAFVVFANLMNQPCQLAFFRLRHAEMERYFLAYDRYFHECLPKLYAHFKQLDVRPNLYLIEWLYTLYAKSLPLEVTCRIWDIFLRDGEEFLFRTAIGILYHYEDVLLHTDFDRCVQFLTHLPDNIRASDLFRSIDDASPSSYSSSSFHLPSVRPSACGGGAGGSEKKRFSHFFNELGDSNRSSATASSSPPCANGQVHKNGHINTPSILFTYAANLLCSSTGGVSSPVACDAAPSSPDANGHMAPVDKDQGCSDNGVGCDGDEGVERSNGAGPDS